MAADTGEYGHGPGNPPRPEIIGVTPFGRPASHLAVAVARAGGTGVLDLGADRESALAALAEAHRWWTGPFGVRVPAGCRVRPAEIPAAVDTVLMDAPALRTDDSLDVAGFTRGRRLLVEVVGPDEAAAVIPVARGFTGDVGLIARGREAGGRVGDLTTFVLLQRLLADPSVDVPVYAAGGIGPHTAAAAVAGGAAGVVLDVQLALVREMDLPADTVAALTAMDGAETTVVQGHRVLASPDLPGTDPVPAAGPPPRPLPVGQDGPLAAALAGRHKTAGGVVQAVREQIGAHLGAAVRGGPLAPREDAPGRVYPVVQGPMAQVSDSSMFAGAVAQEGGLPVLALAAMDGDRVHTLLRETADRLAGRPWGVGVTGTVAPDVREAQLAAVRAAGPPYALLAGGSPAEAAPLQAAGIDTYLYVDSPGPLSRFLDEGARRFVFEGQECGGPVGPRAAFPLWEEQVERLMAFAGEGDGVAAELSVMFAGGVHDERSAAMVAALAGPLAERGADVRVLLGTAYLFTPEAVATGAILPGYQDVALGCAGTALLTAAPGHVTRCARTPYVETFAQTRRELEQVGTARDEVRRRLEKLNLGRLRIAAKGLRRSSPVGGAEQRAEGLYALGQVAALRSETTGVAALHERVTSGATALLAARAAELGVAGTRSGAAGAVRPADIAIIGIGCVFPGADDADRYWANIVAGADCVTEVTRWDPEIHHGPSGEDEGEDDGKTPSKWGGFLPDIPFDADRYGIPPGALGGIDPVQLLALEVASRALRDAGYADRPFDRTSTSVFFGAAGGGDLGTAYGVRATLPSYYGEVPAALDEHLPRPSAESLPGVHGNVIAGRVADRLDLGGAGYTVDAAGAASLAALDAACKELAAGASDMVLCGGADLGTGVQDYLLLAAAGALSPAGRCAAFDVSADGIAPGEGVGCVVLKRLADAERDGDRIYAVVKSVAGAGDGLARPSVEGQQLALERAYDRAGIAPASVGLVETHGTGAEPDDRAELAALSATFTGAAPGGVTLGSVKSQIGHTRRAAGLAGLIKTTYALHTGVLPGTLHLARPNPEWKQDGPFAFGGGARPWPARPGDRYAGLSGFGLGGANFHAVLAGYDGAPEPVSGLAEWPAELFLIRAADRRAARAEIDRLRELSAGEPRLRDLARTTAALQGPLQVAVVATGLDDLRHKLTHAAEFRPAPGVLVAAGEPGQVAFVYPGQGGQRPNMLADLFVAFPRLQRLLRLAGGRYAAAMFPPAAFTADETARHRADIARVAQPALGIAGLAVHRLLTALGVHPDLAAGHGHGELTALCAAGVFDDTDMIELSAARAAATTAAAASAGLRTDLLGRDLRSPAYPVWGNATAAPYDTEPAELAAALAGQVAAPVRFVEQIEAMYEAGARTFVEVGPGRVLTGDIGTILDGRPHTAVSCDAPGENGIGHLLHTLAELAAAGVPVDPLPLFAGRDARPLTAPAQAPGWIVNGHLVRTADGGYPAGGLRPAERVPAPGDRDTEAAVLEYLRNGRELIAAQREVILRHLGGTSPASIPSPRPGADLPAEPLDTVLAVISSRTGYPESMLDADLDLGTDLSIDSIERALIVGELADRFAVPAPQPAARATTIADLAGWLHTHLDEAAPSPPAPPAGPSAHVTATALSGPGGTDPGRPGADDQDTTAPAETPDSPDLEDLTSTQRMPSVLEPASLQDTTSTQELPPEVLALAPSTDTEPAPDGAPTEDAPPPGHNGASAADPAPRQEAAPTRARPAEVRRAGARRPWFTASGAGSVRDEVPAQVPVETLPEAGAAESGQVEFGGDEVVIVRGGAAARDEASGRGAEGVWRVRTDTQVWPRVSDGSGAPAGTVRKVPRVVELDALPVPPQSGTMFTGRRFLIVDDGCGIAAELGDMLERHGAQVRTPLDVDGSCDGLIHLGSLRPGTAGVLPGAYDGIRRALTGGLRWLVVVSGAGGHFGWRFDGGGIGDPAPGAGLRGLARTVADEYPEVLVRALDVDTKNTPRAIALRIVAELMNAEGPVVVGHERDRRHGLSVLPAELGGAPEVPLGPDGVVLLTGGARGVTARVALELARTSGCHIEVVGRTPEPAGDPEFPDVPDEAGLRRALVAEGGAGEVEETVRRILADREVRRNLATLREHAASVRYHAGDVRNAQLLRDVVGNAYVRHGRLDGVVHGAGLAEGRQIRDNAPESFECAYRTKVDGAAALARAVRPDIGFFVVLGDAAGVQGGRGSAEHAAASDACDTLAHVWRTRLRGRVLVADFAPVAADAAAAALLREIAHGGEPQVVFTGADR